jgi:hypothetical protein
MNTERTKREQKLIECIKQLFRLITAQSIYFQTSERNRNWILTEMNELTAKDIEFDILNYLHDEFGIEYTKLTDKDIFEPEHGTQN